MDLSIDVASRERVRALSALGSAHIRPLGLEADRLGRPTPPDHPFFELLLRAGQGRTRWNGREEPARKTREEKLGTSRTTLLLAEEMSYWDRGVAVSFPGPGLGEPPLLSMGTPGQRGRFLGPFIDPDRPRWGSFAMTEPGAGSDVAAIRTHARKDGDTWIL
ncbi:MAG: acyl-CoA dehydrogenase, partial [Myxococcota bacterium]